MFYREMSDVEGIAPCGRPAVLGVWAVAGALDAKKLSEEQRSGVSAKKPARLIGADMRNEHGGETRSKHVFKQLSDGGA